MGMVMAPIAEIAGASLTATAAFVASNLDDIVVLLLLFAGAEGARGRWPVVAGQFVGFGLLVLASLVGWFGGDLLPSGWIGLLGLMPVGLGVSQLLDSISQASDARDQSLLTGADPLLSVSPPLWPPSAAPGGTLLARIVAVAGLTIANGGDNIGLYMPLFAQADRLQLVTTLAVFTLLVGLWCLGAWRLVQAPALALLIHRHGGRAVPWLLIGIGALLLIQHHTFADRALALLALTVLLAMAGVVLRQLQQLALASVPRRAGDLSIPLQ